VKFNGRKIQVVYSITRPPLSMRYSDTDRAVWTSTESLNLYLTQISYHHFQFISDEEWQHGHRYDVSHAFADPANLIVKLMQPTLTCSAVNQHQLGPVTAMYRQLVIKHKDSNNSKRSKRWL